MAHVEPSRLVFLDETGAKTNMTRAYGRARKGERVVDYAPHGHWSTTTLVAGLTCSKAVAPMVLDGPMDSVSFEAYLAQVLIPALERGAIIVMDNLSAHKSPAVARLLQEAGVELWYLPPYSPDFNPIEQMWFKIKQTLRSLAARTFEGLIHAIGIALEEVTKHDLVGWFTHCGYTT